jgi:hypothetical protein
VTDEDAPGKRYCDTYGRVETSRYIENDTWMRANEK